ncbi:MAG: threonylcarbamoyl-AMP synthase [Desulfarculaceae bacterium]|nr:threonylcarbamoyl-AMP synthase [Desulfarculaceae bacterium]MCF8074410.1 threonylcarbamoyl-AMP synthase [Desulfarculaceae bacterium]MCF8103614.1 threonylcarbamoyl-AMP synthase [Desulfarculaceae bacterium]MCF8116027.1 threonylcarbamoyl-AMP synthase [Desulfarculaceae bacterium]
MILEINPEHPQPRRIAQVVQALESGGVVAYPTDTIYGLGCDIHNKKALKRLHQIKRQPESKPFSFICPDLSYLSRYALVTNYAYKTLKRLLPGPYTFILTGSREVPGMMLTRRKTAGIRVPSHPVPLAIVEALGRPLASASATDREGNELLSAWDIEDALGHALDLVVDGGPVPGVASSVISLVDDQPEVIREGAGPVEEFLL